MLKIIQPVLDFPSDGRDKFLHLVFTVFRGVNGLVNDDGGSAGEDVDGAFGENAVGASDGDRNNWQANIQGKAEGAFFKGQEFAVIASGAFGHKHDARSALNGSFGLLYGCEGRFAIAAVDEYMAHFLAGEAKNRNLFQFHFHHPLEVKRQKPHKQENVVIALVIGYEYVTLLFIDVLAAM